MTGDPETNADLKRVPVAEDPSTTIACVQRLLSQYSPLRLHWQAEKEKVSADLQKQFFWVIVSHVDLSLHTVFYVCLYPVPLARILPYLIWYRSADQLFGV